MSNFLATCFIDFMLSGMFNVLQQEQCLHASQPFFQAYSDIR